MTGSRSNSDYTMGWIYALSKEQTAAMVMLDVEHNDHIQEHPGDPNSYTRGSIGAHNIVIACLPRIGTNEAASTITWMAATFPQIKFGLMVGIGGGIPSKVRLGDVVVSVPVGRFPGVIQWDMGKAEAGGRFTRTGSLNAPPNLLLTAITKMQSANEKEGSRIPEYLEVLRTNHPLLVPHYLRSDRLEDIAFDADNDHVGTGTDGGKICENCNKDRAERREVGEVKVHYGLIASGNKVIKDGMLRTKLERKYKGKLLCVEMEAAGLMNTFPCLVIRGICDYADSHKNDPWQEHAAAIAAAYAKELLQHVEPADVKNEPAIKDLVVQGE